MRYKGYKLVFQNGVHFGNNSIEGSEYIIHSDTLFSALCHEANKIGSDKLEQLISLFKSGNVKISDAMPFCGDTLYIPKPMKKIEYEEQGDSSVKKAFKNLSYIPAEKLDDYLMGKLDIKEENNKFSQFGIMYSRNMASIRGKEEAEPYRVGVYQFCEGNGLYIILGFYEDEHVILLEELLDQLSFAGLGGRRSSGLGRFELNSCSLADSILKRFEKDGSSYMTLSIALPKEEELDNVLVDADYIIIKRSGFVLSEKYANEHLRKKDLYVINSGACFSKRFDGDIYDVSSDGRHPVYKYAKPFLMEVDI